MKFNIAQEVDQLCYQIRLADYPRSLNRARIDDLLNGKPPYTSEEVQQNHINININDLTGTRTTHDARAQLYQNFMKPGQYMAMTTDYGPRHKRQKCNTVVSRELARMMKRNQDYFECLRGIFALDIAHGIGPHSWLDGDFWCPECRGITDIGVPSGTLLTMKNLPFFYVYKSFTAPELIKLTRGPKVDPGWNVPLVDKCLEWIDRETMQLMGSNWPEVWSPEKAHERVKGDGGLYCGSQVPTIDCFDFYFWNDDDKEEGWCRRILLDSWSTPQSTGVGYTMSRKSSYPGDEKNDFLYSSKMRKFARSWREIVGFQFADLSAVAPFHYDCVRSLGWLIYAACHLQNRMRCKFNEAVFEALLNYFRVSSMDEAERALKVELANHGFIDDSLKFVTAQERWQVNENLVKLGLDENERIITTNASSYVQNQNFSRDRVEKTKFQVMAEVSATTTLVSAGLLQAVSYYRFQCDEIKRRAMKENSKDPEVREFRARCLKQGVPTEVMVPEAWEAEPERVMGAGNKTMEMAIAQQLLEMRPMYDPEPQRKILEVATLAVTDNAALTEELVPEEPHVSDSVHDSELAFGTLMAGNPVTPKSGLNSSEVASTIIKLMANKVKQIMAQGGVGTPLDVVGLILCARYAGEFIKNLEEDDKSKSLVRKLNEALKNVMNEVKAMKQRQEEMAKKAAQAQAQNNGGDPKSAAAAKATIMKAEVDNQVRSQSAAERTAQKRVQFEQKMQQDAQKHQMNMELEAQKHGLETRKSLIEHGANLAKTAMDADESARQAKIKKRTEE